jgi:hypothetical protein
MLQWLAPTTHSSAETDMMQSLRKIKLSTKAKCCT